MKQMTMFNDYEMSPLDLAIEHRSHEMAQAQYNEQTRSQIIGLLIAEGAKDLSDEEINRCTEYCAAAWVGRVAKMYRDTGYIQCSDLYDVK